MLRPCWKEKQKENFHSRSRCGCGRDRSDDQETFSRLLLQTELLSEQRFCQQLAASSHGMQIYRKKWHWRDPGQPLPGIRNTFDLAVGICRIDSLKVS